MDLEKVKAILYWLVPKYLANIRSFMQIIGYYYRFIKLFSNLAYHITSLQNKVVKFEWTQQCQSSFERLKHLLTIAPMLKISDPNKYFEVGINAFLECLGGVPI